VIGIQLIDGQVLVTLPQAVLVLSKVECIHALQRGKAWRRRTLEPRPVRPAPTTGS
jgi:hypothetical protein